MGSLKDSCCLIITYCICSQHQVSALKEESKIKAQEIEVYKQVVSLKSEEIDKLLAQLQHLEEKGHQMQLERTQQHSVQQLQSEQQLHQLTVDSSKAENEAGAG